VNVFYVYEHWRTDRDECFYVGKGHGRRAYDMKRRNKYHQAIVSKILRTGFAVEIKIVASNLKESEAYKLEIDRIKFWREANIELANLSSGGEGGTTGVKVSLERRAKISSSLKGHPVSEEQRKKQAITYKKNMTEERRQKLRNYGLEKIDLFKKYQSLGPKSSAKKVICVDDNLEFKSASAASRHYNTAKSAIIELCLGKKNRKTVTGKVFKYVEEV